MKVDWTYGFAELNSVVGSFKLWQKPPWGPQQLSTCQPMNAHQLGSEVTSIHHGRVKCQSKPGGESLIQLTSLYRGANKIEQLPPSLLEHASRIFELIRKFLSVQPNSTLMNSSQVKCIILFCCKGGSRFTLSVRLSYPRA